MQIKAFNRSYFIVKIIFMIIAIYIYSKFTTLGDTETYINGGHSDYKEFSIYTSTGLMTKIGIIFHQYLILPILSCMPFVILSYASVKYVLNRYPFLNSNLFFLLLLMPNFLIYTSVFSKEAVSTVFGAIFAVWVISYVEGNFKIKILYILATIICIIFKPQFVPFVFEALFFIWITKRIHSKFIITFIALSIWILNIAVIYYYRDIIDEGAQIFKLNFLWGEPKSTRETDDFSEKYGVFKNLPYGMFISFWGPTIKEMMAKPAQLLAGIESFLIFIIYFLIFIGAIIKRNITTKIFWAFSFIFLGLLVMHYPFGYFNPGSAIRYRQNFHLLFAILLIYLYKRNKIYEKKYPPLLV